MKLIVALSMKFKQCSISSILSSVYCLKDVLVHEICSKALLSVFERMKYKTFLYSLLETVLEKPLINADVQGYKVEKCI